MRPVVVLLVAAALAGVGVAISGTAEAACIDPSCVMDEVRCAVLGDCCDPNAQPCCWPECPSP